MATDTVSNTSFWNSRSFLILAVLFQLACGLWLSAGFYPRLTRLGAIALFTAFFEISLYQLLAGKRSCGCLGRIELSPLLTLVFDLIAVGMLSAWSPPLRPPPTFRTHPLRVGVIAVTFTFFAFPGTIAMVYYSPKGIMGYLRSDPSLGQTIALDLKNPTVTEILDVLQKRTGLSMTMESGLEHLPADFGRIAVRKAPVWSLMIMAAERQAVPSRWEKCAGGYRLVRASPFGHPIRPWAWTGFILALIVGGFTFVKLTNQRGRLPQSTHPLLKEKVR